MSKFEVGQEVLFSRGDRKDLKGVIVNPHFQISQSDWPEVLVQYHQLRFFVDIDKVRPAVDPYEYGATWKMRGSEEYYPVFSEDWGTLEEAKANAEYAKTWDMQDTKIMRRLKPGEPEDFTG